MTLEIRPDMSKHTLAEDDRQRVTTRDRVIDQFFDLLELPIDPAARWHCHEFYRSLAENTGLTFDTLQHIHQCFGIWLDELDLATEIRDGHYHTATAIDLLGATAWSAVETIRFLRQSELPTPPTA